MFRIHVPTDSGIFHLAASELVRYVKAMTGLDVAITQEEDGDLLVLGSAASNPFVARLFLDRSLSVIPIKSGSDDYYLYSLEESGRQLLLLGGGRPRALLYAVYDYLERCGCSWFYDEDIIPRRDVLPLGGFTVVESPRFQYRGLRYFAHRGLHRFQAEHWTLSDWQKELDWVLKKRLNLFMLRIGMDDLFQKAFPDLVPYPEDGQPCEKQFSRSFNDRTPFWSLQGRGQLRKAILDYAFARDLMHPEDTGTLSHWYSRTPKAFLEQKNPPFIPQASEAYCEPSGLVWDIRKDEWLEMYFKLTATHIKEYGKPELFHTIGLAERSVSTDPEVNHRWKLYTYRRIINRLRKDYPDAPLLVGSWDFNNTHWTPEEMHTLISMLDPANTLILDYTSDSDSEEDWFMNWSIYRKFPWIFGIFEAYEPGNDLRGNYTTINRRLRLAADDPACKGMVIWAENSHSDILMYEFFAANAWQPHWMDIQDFIPLFCHRRYGKLSATMEVIWQAFLPAIRSGHWSNNGFAGEIFAHLNTNWHCLDPAPESIGQIAEMNDRIRPCIVPTVKALQLLMQLPLDHELLLRDAIDLARTATARCFQYVWLQIPLRPIRDHAQRQQILALLRSLLQALTTLLGADQDYSLNHSLERLAEGGPVNPCFEQTLKANVDNGYCRSFIYELCVALYLPELELWGHYLLTGETDEKAWSDLREAFHSSPLSTYRPDLAACRSKLPETFAQLRTLLEQAAAL